MHPRTTVKTDDLEKALRRAEARLEGIVGIAADAVISVDADQRIVYFNQGAERIFGWNSEEVLGESLDILIPPGAREAHREHMARFGAGQELARRMGHQRPISGLRRTGHEFPAEASISKHTVDGETLYHVVLRDVTDQRRVESQQRFLADAGELLTSTLDIPEMLARATAAAVPLLADACVIWLLEPDAGELRVTAAHAVSSTADSNSLLDRLRGAPIPMKSSHAAVRVIESGTSVRFMVGDSASAVHEVGIAPIMQRAVRGTDAPHIPGPAAFDVHGLLVPISAASETHGVLALYSGAGLFDASSIRIAEDFARRLALAMDNGRLYESAQRAIRARDETIAVVSHDLRNPVNAIRMLAGVLLQRSENNPVTLDVVREELATIVQGARQADSLIQDLLDVARIEAEGLSVAREPVDLAVLLRESAELLRPIAADGEIRLQIELPDELPMIAADAERVQQVISNLVGNAVKFTARGGLICIGAERDAHEVRVRVEDTGEGIEPDQLDHIFDRYWQGNPRTRRGAGLGLTIACGIVEAHGGRMWVQSTPRVGSVFWFTLPIMRYEG